MLTFVEERKQLKIFVSVKAKKIVEDFAEQFDMKEQGVASRIYNWFGSIPLPVQKWIIGLTDGTEGQGMKLFAKALADGNIHRFPSIPPEPQSPGAPAAKPAEQPAHSEAGRASRKSK